jgi:hypothetical protein
MSSSVESSLLEPPQTDSSGVESKLSALKELVATKGVRKDTMPPPRVAIALPREPKEKRIVPSAVVDIKPSFSSAASKGGSLSDTSSTMSTPKTAKEYQTPTPSPMPLSSSPVASTSSSEQITHISATGDAQITPKPSKEFATKSDASASTFERSKKPKKKKQGKKKKKVSAGEAEAEAEVPKDTLKPDRPRAATLLDTVRNRVTGEIADKDNQRTTTSDSNYVEAFGEAGTQRNELGADNQFVEMQDTTFNKVSKVKENTSSSSTKPSYAATLATKGTGLFERSSNIPGSRQT